MLLAVDDISTAALVILNNELGLSRERSFSCARSLVTRCDGF